MKPKKATAAKRKAAKGSQGAREDKIIVCQKLAGTKHPVVFVRKKRPLPKGAKPEMFYGDAVHNPAPENTVFVWCLHCERTYRRGECRVIGGLQMCPYKDCDGDTVFDAWEWFQIRGYNPQYPVIPETGKCYPMYP